MTIDKEMALDAAAQAIVELRNVQGERNKLVERIEVILERLSEDECRKVTPYPLCLRPTQCAGLSSCPRDPCCID